MKKIQAYSRTFQRYQDRIVSQGKFALDDDVGDGDITTLAVVNESLRCEDAVIIVKSDGILCGIQEAKTILEAGGLKFESKKIDGDVVSKGDIIARVNGYIEELLKRERTALNYIQVMSGIATATYNLVSRYPGKVASLRKTHPGLCYSEKRAVEIGGGFSHRLGLYDGFLIKDNHLAAVIKEMFGDGPITEEQKVKSIIITLRRAKEYRIKKELKHYFIEVEVETLKQAVVAAKLSREEGVPDMILLDNMAVKDVKKCVEAIRKEAGQEVLIEASGGITSNNISAYLDAGVDVISTSEITLSAKPLDVSMKIVDFK